MRSLRNAMRTMCVMQASPVMHAVTRVCGTHRITYHSEAASLITCLQNTLICGIIQLYHIFTSYLNIHCMQKHSLPILLKGVGLYNKRTKAISNQIGRSGTSIGANIHEAQYAQGKKDFISKLEIALKEASETGYWLELLYRTKYIDEQTYKALSSKCTSLRVMLIASCRTAKENGK